MKLHEVVAKANEDGGSFRRCSWTHADSLIIRATAMFGRSYGGGELWWAASDTRATLFYADDLTADDWDWSMENESTTARKGVSSVQAMRQDFI